MSTELQMDNHNLLDRDTFNDIFNSVKMFDQDISEDSSPQLQESSGKELLQGNQDLDLDLDMDLNLENCKDCQTDSLVYEDGAYFCHNCGKFQEVRINQEQEWRFYGDSDSKSTDPTRVGMPMNQLLPESSLGTVISNKGSHSVEFEKLRQYHTWNTMPYKERSLYRVYERLQSKAVKAGIPICIIENAKSMYKQLSEAQISRGAKPEGFDGQLYLSGLSNGECSKKCQRNSRYI